MSWPVGTIVVCVDARIRHPYLWEMARPSSPLAEGGYYTVRCTRVSHTEGEIVHLNEIICRPHPSGNEFGFCPTRFRKAESDHSEAGSIRQEQTA